MFCSKFPPVVTPCLWLTADEEEEDEEEVVDSDDADEDEDDELAAFSKSVELGSHPSTINRTKREKKLETVMRVGKRLLWDEERTSAGIATLDADF